MAQANRVEPRPGSDRTIGRFPRRGGSMDQPRMGSDQNHTPEGQAPITVVLVDDEHLIRAALARALSDGGIELVGEAVNGEDALDLIVDVRPDVALRDLRLPGLSGVKAIEQLGLLAPAS